jgi:hypothetical protein
MIFSQHSGPTCEFWANPVDFTFSLQEVMANPVVEQLVEAVLGPGTFSGKVISMRSCIFSIDNL